jgi:hypothetical protein
MTQGVVISVRFLMLVTGRSFESLKSFRTLRFLAFVARGSVFMRDDGGSPVASGRIPRDVAKETSAMGHNTGREQIGLPDCLPPWSG